MSEATSVLFGLEHEFSVLEVQQVDTATVKVIVEQAAREGPCPECRVFSGTVKDRPWMRWKDLPVSRQAVELWWRNAADLRRGAVATFRGLLPRQGIAAGVGSWPHRQLRQGPGWPSRRQRSGPRLSRSDRSVGAVRLWCPGRAAERADRGPQVASGRPGEPNAHRGSATRHPGPARPPRHHRRPDLGQPAAAPDGAEHLSAKQWKRLGQMLDYCDPTKEIGAAWAVKERLRMLLAEREPSRIRRRLAEFYEAAIGANMTRPPGSAGLSRHGGRRSWSHSPTRCPTLAQKDATG